MKYGKEASPHTREAETSRFLPDTYLIYLLTNALNV